jgi:hypothetical protein
MVQRFGARRVQALFSTRFAESLVSPVIGLY